jgi:hypothetical protein
MAALRETRLGITISSRNPVVTVEVGTEKFKARATQVYGTERDRLFAATAKLIPLFADYQNKTKRQIPLFTLTRID